MLQFLWLQLLLCCKPSIYKIFFCLLGESLLLKADLQNITSQQQNYSITDRDGTIYGGITSTVSFIYGSFR